MPLRALVALLLFMSAPLTAEVIDRITLDNEKQRFVSAPSGLRLRESPSLAAEVIATMPFGSAVLLLKQSEVEVVFDGLRGHWAVVRYEAHTGWAFTGFLSNEILPDANVRHWTASKTMYFVLTESDPGTNCAHSACQLNVFNRNHVHVATYEPSDSRPSMAASGWKSDTIILAVTAVCASGGGYVQTLWNPMSDELTPYFSDQIINNSPELSHLPLPDGAPLTYELCIAMQCFFINLNTDKNTGNLYQGKARADHPGKAQIKLIAVRKYTQHMQLESHGRKPFLNVDGKLYSLPELKPQ